MTGKRCVLIVDDQAHVLQMLGLIFQKAGFDVMTAQSGPEALAKVKETKPDLALLDVMMPDMSGIELCRQLRSQSATARLPIIMLSAKGDVPDKVDGFKAGADDYVTKPVARQELLARAQALLQRAQYKPTPTARIVAFVGAKGGVGTTTVAVNVATALQAVGNSMTLVELRSYPGTVLYHLNMTAKQDLGHLLAMEATELNEREINRRLVQHRTGVRVLAAPQDIEAHRLTAEHVSALLDILSFQTDYLFLDIPVMTGEAMRRTLERADQILLVTEPERTSVKAARAILEQLKQWAIFDQARVVMVSRAPSAMLMRRGEVENELGVAQEQGSTTKMGGSVVAMVPPTPEAFHQESRLGTPVVISKPELLAAKALIELAEWLVENVPVAASA
jgi:DNA-binding response OmpR family regulator